MTEISDVTSAEHLCWVYEDGAAPDAAFDAAVRAFLAGGLARGERLLCVGERILDVLRGDPGTLAGIDALVADGALQAFTVSEAYDATGDFAPERQLEFYDAATRRALDEGYTGLRVVADVSTLAADERRRPDLLRWEQLADDYVAHGPGMSALCAYRGDLGSETVGDAASVHPLIHVPASPPFQLFSREGRLALTGSVDTFTADRLSRMLASSPGSGATATLDMSGTEFIDVAGCRALARWAADLAARGGALQITGASRLVVRMWQILDLEVLAPVVFLAAPE